MAGQIGFDEGGVLESLSKPFFNRKITFDKKGRVVSTEDEYNVSMAHVVAVAVLWYGPQALEWFKTSAVPGVAGAVEGVSDILAGAANYAQDIILKDDNTPVQTDPYTRGSTEFEGAMRHSQITRGEFERILVIAPPPADTEVGDFVMCQRWRNMTTRQKNLYRSKWRESHKIRSTWEWPGCLLQFFK